jgi:hypothetical protein
MIMLPASINLRQIAAAVVYMMSWLQQLHHPAGLRLMNASPQIANHSADSPRVWGD